MYDTFLHSEATAPMRTNVVALILRLALALVFLFAGLDKILHGSGGADWVNVMYERQPPVREQVPERQRQITEVPTFVSFMGTQLVVAWAEFLGGLALLVGVLTRWAALGEIIIQIGAIILVTLPRGFRFQVGTFEFNLVLIAMCLALVILGPGRWSVDRVLRERRMTSRRTATATAPMPLAGPHAVTANQPAEQVTRSAPS
jgi:putative oxidoreductase